MPNKNSKRKSANNSRRSQPARELNAEGRRLPPGLLGLLVAVISGLLTWGMVRSFSGGAKATASKGSSQVESPERQAQATSDPLPGGSFQPTIPNASVPTESAPEGMVWIPGGEFSMGCEDPTGLPSGGPDAMHDARPILRVYVDGFWMDKTEVTNQQFAKFVEETAYVTVAERVPRAEDFPGAPLENLVAGSVVFTPPSAAVPLNNHFQWWAYIPGANWRHPTGPDSSLEGLENYPVVQVVYEDAQAYGAWAGKRLPTEAEWEFAARGGLTGNVYAWGNEFRPEGKWAANTFQGEFPIRDLAEDRFAGIAPTAQFPPNPYGLFDIGGNVWEWCSDWYRADSYRQLSMEKIALRNPLGPKDAWDPAEPSEPKRVHRGGSFLCTDEYCTRYMIGARGKGEQTTGSNHVGFRCIQVPAK